MESVISIGGFDINVTRKDIKNIHLSVYPPTGDVRISAPVRMDLESVRAFALTKLEWIKDNQGKLLAQARESKRQLIDHESILIWGQRRLVKIHHGAQKRDVTLTPRYLELLEPAASEMAGRHHFVEGWFRSEVRSEASKSLVHWQSKLGVEAKKLFVRRMRTKWGSCNADSGSIRLNTELIHKPKEALEFVIVHELLHFIERRHNDRFYSLLDAALPRWRLVRQELNALPLSYATWSTSKTE